MNIGKPFIQNPVMTILLFTALIVFSIFAYLKLPASDLPEINFPVLQVETFYPGANSETVASTVTSPIEKECMQIQGLENITSTSEDSHSIITLTFPAGEDANDYLPRLQEALGRAEPNLPKLPNPPQILETNPSSKPVMFILVSSDILTDGELYDIAYNNLTEKISIIKGVSFVAVSGVKTAVRVQLNPVKLAAYKLDTTDIAAVLDKATLTAGEGSINGSTTFTLEFDNSQLTKADQYNNIIVKYINDTPLKLQELGEVHDSSDNDVYKSTLYENGEKIADNPVFIVVYPSDGANNIDIADKINKLLIDTKKELPDSVEVFVANDRSTIIVRAIDDITTTLILSFILVVSTLYLFLGRFRDTLIPSIALIPAVLGVFLVMYLVGYSINILSLMAIILAIGFVIDDAIVVHENSHRLAGLGYTAKEASLKSAKDLSVTVISTSIALIVVFLPIYFMGGITGLSLREFAGTVIIAITFSSIIALTLLPMLCSLLIKPYKEEKKTKVQKFCDLWIGYITKKYSRLLRFVLKHKYISIILWCSCIGGVILLYPIVAKDFIPVGDSGVIKGQFITPLGTSTTEIRKYQESINGILKKDPNISHFITISGESSGGDQSRGSIFIFTKPESEREPIQTICTDLKKRIDKEAVPIGITYIAPTPFISLPTTDNAAEGTDYSYLISGSSSESVVKSADEFTTRLNKLSEFNSVQNSIKLDMPKVIIHILRDKLYSYDLSVNDVLETISNAFAQNKTTDFTTELDQYDVYIELSQGFRSSLSDIDDIHITSSETGLLIPLLDVAVLEKTVGPQDVVHSQKQYAAVISFNLSKGVSIGDATEIINRLSEEILPSGVKGALEGSAQQFEESMSSMGILMVVSVFLLYIVLGMLYESFVHPLTVLTTLPLAAFGALFSLVVSSSVLSLYAYIGVFLLLGNIAKNGIILVDYANQMIREKKMNSYDAIYEACITRLRPILMTGITTVMAAVPLVVGIGYDASSRRPLGIVIVGGYIFGTIITLFVTPGLFLYMQRIQKSFFDKFEFSRTKIRGGKSESAETK
ncbi:MAG: efflux RND transporter permease subunit [bacterium]|nr:efflux RND transporter permease subunit [bacterium]